MSNLNSVFLIMPKIDIIILMAGQSIMQWMLKLPRESFHCMLDSSGTMKLPLALEKFRALRLSTLLLAYY